jgi:hypothetical protein
MRLSKQEPAMEKEVEDHLWDCSIDVEGPKKRRGAARIGIGGG